MKKILVIFCLFTTVISAQMNRPNMGTNITNFVYQNNTHAVTGANLQGVMVNQNNSYVNLISDTNLLGLRIFSPYATYTPGMGAFHGDTLYMNISTQHGAWSRSNWMFIAGGGCACYTFVTWSDTGSGQAIATQHTVSLATTALIPWADTNTKIATNHSILQTIASYPFLSWTDTLTKLATNHGVMTVADTLIGKSDTGSGKLIVSTSVLVNTLINKIQPGSGITISSGTGYGSRLISNTHADTGLNKSASSVYQRNIALHDTVLRMMPIADSGNVNNTINGHYYSPFRLLHDTAHGNNVLVGQAYLASYVGQHSGTNYLNDTIGGSGGKPTLVPQHYLQSIFAGSTNITTLGTVITGIWTGTPIAKGYLNDSIIVAGTGLSISRSGGNITLTNTSIGYVVSDSLNGSTHKGTRTQLLTNFSGAVLGGQAVASSYILGTTNNVSVKFIENNVASGGINGNGGVSLGYNSLDIVNNQFSTVVGESAMNGSNGFTEFDVAVGYAAGQNLYQVNYNTLIGNVSGNKTVSGTGNSFLGSYSGYNNVSGSYNSVNGDSALANNKTGNYNNAFGWHAGLSNTSLSHQTYLSDSLTNLTVKFTGALMPYYSSNFQAGTTGQVLESQGAGISPKYVTEAHISNTGTATLSSGTATISVSGVTSGSYIFVQNYNSGSLTNVGVLSVVPGSGSFVVNSSNALDSSPFIYWIVK